MDQLCFFPFQTFTLAISYVDFKQPPGYFGGINCINNPVNRSLQVFYIKRNYKFTTHVRSFVVI